jgi:YD repeat-containing protein
MSRPPVFTTVIAYYAATQSRFRDNLLLTSDAQHSPDPADLIPDPLGRFPAPGQDSRGVTQINRPGNTVERFFDGLSRQIAEVRHLRVDGQGRNPIDTTNPANPDGLIVINYQWDPNGRLVAVADDGLTTNQNTSVGLIESGIPRGNVTRYRYDDLNRRKQEISADATLSEYTYDADNNLIRVVDPNGSVTLNSYDVMSRLVRRDVTRAPSTTHWLVAGTTLQLFEYDGLSRTTRADDNNSVEQKRLRWSIQCLCTRFWRVDRR